MNTCFSCLFWLHPIPNDKEGSPWGQCHRWPPIAPAISGQPLGSAYFPLTISETWCGEYFAKEEQEIPSADNQN